MNKTYLFCALLFLASISTHGQTNDHVPDAHKMIKAVYYFADAWPITFWQEFEASRIDADIQRIKRDGFNTVMLAVPWIGFETDFSAQRTKSDPRLYQRLDLLLKKFTEASLDYILRVGYLHTLTPGVDTGKMELCLRMYSDDHTRGQWKDYLRKLRRITKRHRKGLTAILISWEDFWCVHNAYAQNEEEKRRSIATQLGYGEWLQSQDPDIVRILMGEDTITVDEVIIPTTDEPAHYLFLKFTREILDGRILDATRSVFSQAAMEVRVDRDPVESHKEKIWIGNNLFLDEKNLRGTYWAPSWNARNVSEQLTADQALFNLNEFLKYVSADGASTHHVVGQFNFFDNTPHSLDNARIAVSAIPAFLKGAAPLIQEYSAGYGLWAYQDYADNVLYNASFEFDLEGWAVEGRATVVRGVGENRLSMKNGSKITQRFEPEKRFSLGWVYDNLSLCFCSETNGQAVISEGENRLVELDITAGRNCHSMKASPITRPTEAIFGFRALSDLVIDDLKLYGFVQSLGVYDEFGQPGTFLEEIRRLNGNLDDPANPTRYINQPEFERGNQCASTLRR